ncbi:ABC transporter ATP-binding protein [Cellulomonas wangsupingiae]|uniref:ABC transporter ATP-binding protein n=1 Tax=Cellulomonas wangsupingiae TaxID=2968085 RepID=A0ABY5K293_9CELL|nr:ABC transporter ATP-binding protein [Cellulomonas wangsupingiae]MCC2335689.1 ABC transporter ATP-binding protein [Cellulomonas wangsupingiae]MCM0640320.1 ABC transporter ATP-binding protein [Cellulomonas wangsupingiae]UUI63924.1 ABC transporter ATP-binding protein [Cellulomonas wangsupingiae]
MTDTAIEAVDLWKSFRVYQERSHTLKERFIGRSNRYDEFWALKGVNFEVPTGSTLGIVGPNGSGKSTTLKVLAKILSPNRGHVRVNGSIASLLELGTGFHPDLTGRENVYLASSVLGRSEKQTDALYESIVDFAGVQQFMDLPVKNYSSGMYARLAFAVSISVEPDVLLLDEVLAVGDEEFQMKCYDRIAHFRDTGRTIVLVSHSLDTIRSMCRDALWIEKGDLKAYGPSDEVVAQYLGDVHVESQQQTRLEGDNRFGNGDVVITAVRFLDERGRATTALRGAAPASIEVDYEMVRPVDELVIGFAIHRADSGQHVHGQNSLRSDLGLALPQAGTVRFSTDDLPLLKGPHQVTVAAHDRSSAGVYDWHDRAYPLSILDGPRTLGQSGIVHVPGTWSLLEKPTTSADAPQRTTAS